MTTWKPNLHGLDSRLTAARGAAQPSARGRKWHRECCAAAFSKICNLLFAAEPAFYQKPEVRYCVISCSLEHAQYRFIASLSIRVDN
jgi:hypothetical protein